MDFYDELCQRGLIKDVTDAESFKARLKEPLTIYCGFDPSADSLHVGSLQQIVLLKRYQNRGHRIIFLCGGATGMIGDPRPTTERRLLSAEEIDYNVSCLKQQVSNFFDFENEAIMVNNYDWTVKINVIDFLRDYGKYFNVSYMLSKDVVASRLEKGISYTEFSYAILQSLDWLHLYREYDCIVQIGGSDQWGNLTSGCELIRKIEGDKVKVYGVTSPLVSRSDGSKFGKSEGINIWIDPRKTNAYEFYQFWLNTPDDDVIDYLLRFSFRSLEEIDVLAQSLKTEAHLRKAQKALAEELTELVHGPTGLSLATKISETLFGGDFTKLTLEELKVALSGMKEFEISEATNIVDLLVAAEIASSKREAREWISQGSITVNGEKLTELIAEINKENAFFGTYTIIRRGKKNYYVIKHQ